MAVEDIGAPEPNRGGRPTIDPSGAKGVKVPGTWLSPSDSEALALLVARYRRRNRGSVPDARRAILLAGIHAITATMDAADDLMVDAVMGDRRYSVQRERTGDPVNVPGLETGQRWVARFCGEWIGAAVTQVDAWRVAAGHRCDWIHGH